MTNELTLENIRSGAFPSDAHAVGFLLGEIERLRAESLANFNEAVKSREEVLRLHGNLSLAEEGLANYALEIERLQKREGQLMEFLRSFISGGVNQDFKPWARELYQKLYGTHEPNSCVSGELRPLDGIRDGDGVWKDGFWHPDPPSESPQAPIAKIRVWAHLPPDVKLYAPGLPPGEHDVYCEPMSVAPALGASRDASGANEDPITSGSISAGKSMESKETRVATCGICGETLVDGHHVDNDPPTRY